MLLMKHCPIGSNVWICAAAEKGKIQIFILIFVQQKLLFLFRFIFDTDSTIFDEWLPIKNPDDVNNICTDGKPALVKAIENGNCRLFRFEIFWMILLFELHYHPGHLDLAKFLIENGADVNARDLYDNVTSLALVAKYGNYRKSNFVYQRITVFHINFHSFTMQVIWILRDNSSKTELMWMKIHQICTKVHLARLQRMVIPQKLHKCEISNFKFYSDPIAIQVVWT